MRRRGRPLRRRRSPPLPGSKATVQPEPRHHQMTAPSRYTVASADIAPLPLRPPWWSRRTTSYHRGACGIPLRRIAACGSGASGGLGDVTGDEEAEAWPRSRTPVAEQVEAPECRGRPHGWRWSVVAIVLLDVDHDCNRHRLATWMARVLASRHHWAGKLLAIGVRLADEGGVPLGRPTVERNGVIEQAQQWSIVRARPRRRTSGPGAYGGRPGCSTSATCGPAGGRPGRP